MKYSVCACYSSIQKRDNNKEIIKEENKMGTIGDFGTLSLKWDPKNLEIRTMSVEKTLEPLVLQVTTLVNTKGPSKKKKGSLYILI